MTDRLGFIGLGIMGSGMAANLLARGHQLTVWNRTRERMKPLIAAGAEAAGSPADLAAGSDIVMICVSDTPDVIEVVQAADGVLGGIRPGSIVVDHSTISPSATREMAAEVAKSGASWLDAPVSGGSEGAQRGTLSVMAGGSSTDIARVRPYLEAFGSSITHVGGVGDGQLVKLVNQILVAVNQLAVSEALLFARAAGLDLDQTLDAVKGGAAGSWMLANRGPQMIADDWRPGFTIDLQTKDLQLVIEEANRLGFPVDATRITLEMYRSLQARGFGGEGNHALVKALEESTGVRLNG